MRFISRNATYIVLLAGLLNAADAKGQMSETMQASLRYDIRASMEYIEQLRNPASVVGHIDGNMMRAPAASLHSERGLGLTEMRAELIWDAAEESEFYLLLRPDALLSRSPSSNGTTSYDFDSRVSQPYKKAPEIKLLDAYQISVLSAHDARARVGLFERLATYHLAYRPLLMFGLLTLLPDHYFGAQLHWTAMRRDAPLAQQRPPSGFGFKLTAMQGDRDRNEQYVWNEATKDWAPGTRDPYMGAAVEGYWRSPEGLLIGLISSYGSEGIEQGHINQLYVQGYLTGHTEIAHKATRFAVDLRYAKHEWKSSQRARLQTENLEPVSAEEQSISVSLSPKIQEKHWLLFGGHYGTRRERSERGLPQRYQAHQRYRGWQLDLGYRYRVARFTMLSLMVAEERRTLKTSDGTVGGFGDDASQRKNLVRRVAVELTYALSEG